MARWKNAVGDFPNENFLSHDYAKWMNQSSFFTSQAAIAHARG